MESSTETKNNLLERLPVIAILFLLIFIIFARTGESIHGQVTQLGAYIWDDYFVLRADISDPVCDPSINIQDRLNQLEAESISSSDDFDLFDEGFDRQAAQTSLENQLRLCQQEHAQVAEYRSKVTPAVQIFSAIEHKFSEISIFSTDKQTILLLSLLFIAACVATMKRHHIGFRPMVSKLDFQISLALQLIANTALAASAWKFKINMMSYDIASNNPEIVNGMAIGATALALLSVKDIFSIPKDAPSGGTIRHALLSVPLYTMVMLLFAFIVIINQGNLAGLSLYFSAFFDHSGTYIDVSLYLWCGMLLKQTQVGERVFSLFTPWRLPPELLAFVAIVVMALPTAYTGASSIIILAMGAVVYRELRKVGTRRQLALAATAMSGSSGIVLKPCLIVIIVSILNKEVVSDDLFYWGVRVFLLTALVFFVYALIVRKDPLKIAPVNEALPDSLSNARPLMAYVIIFLLVSSAYYWVLDARLDQFSAPVILPVIIFWMIVYERLISKEKPLYNEPERIDTLPGSLTKSMTDASIHIGGLLMLMSTFMIMTSLGAETVSATFLYDVDNTYLIMGALMLMFVLIGMFMESMAAIGLVSLAIAPIAYEQGINPIHFWMTCLVALELGYLSPPVALSHIFTRQVVGEEEAVAASQEGENFYYRHERLILPILVMGTTLLIVGFGPLIYGINR